jgi:hypothetical protein
LVHSISEASIQNSYENQQGANWERLCHFLAVIFSAANTVLGGKLKLCLLFDYHSYVDAMGICLNICENTEAKHFNVENVIT